MSTMKLIVWAAAMTVCAAAAIAQDANSPEGWPRTFEKDGYSVTMYQPQVDGWKAYSKIRFRAAIAVTSEKTGEVHYGALAVQADTLVDHEARTVLLTNLDGAVNFPGLPADQAAELRKPVMDLLAAKSYVNVSLDRILAYMHNKTKPRVADISMSPPPIYYSDVPAIMVIYIGEPQFKPVSDTDLMFAVNTNWAVFLDKSSARYYLLDEDYWLTAPDPVKGPWTGAESLPGGLSSLPAGKAWNEVRKNVPGNPPPANIPKVYASTTPAELIVTNGPPVYAPVSGTRLMYVSNPEMPVFMDLINNEYYYLVSGRWFEAEDLNGPWSAASADLPAEFAKIPEDSPVGYVLASVPGTQEAEDAVMLAEVPHKATVNKKNTTVNVTYSGEPKFEPIKGTDMKYAVNTAYQVIYADQQYYCCYNGVWFVAPVAAGPWAVCASVPAVIYTIPATSPLYNVTYVKVYSYTPDTVVVGYTGGYSGEYVAATGALMFGAGLAVGAALSDDYWYQYNPCFYSYGCAPYYSYAYGGYYRAAGRYYGPYGGAGWGAAYNPATGTWARAGYAYGPEGAHWGAQAYNPWTNTYAEHTGGTTGYRSWGQTSVSHDGAWAEAGHVSGPAGTKGWVETSSGKGAVGVHTAGGTTVARTSGGDIYAGHDGNVYKRDSGGQWQKYQGGRNWSEVQTPRPYAGAAAGYGTMQSRAQGTPQESWRNNWNSSQWKNNWQSGAFGAGEAQNRWSQHDTQFGLNQDSWARQRGNENAFSSWQGRTGGFGGFGGGFQRGGFGGGGFRGGGFRR